MLTLQVYCFRAIGSKLEKIFNKNFFSYFSNFYSGFFCGHVSIPFFICLIIYLYSTTKFLLIINKKNPTSLIVMFIFYHFTIIIIIKPLNEKQRNLCLAIYYVKKLWAILWHNYNERPNFLHTIYDSKFSNDIILDYINIWHKQFASISPIICEKKIPNQKSQLIVNSSPIDQELKHQWVESTSKIHFVCSVNRKTGRQYLRINNPLFQREGNYWHNNWAPCEAGNGCQYCHLSIGK